MSRTHAHTPWNVTDARLADMLGDDWQSHARGASVWHTEAMPTFRTRRNIATRDARRRDRHNTRMMIRAGDFDAVRTSASFAGESRSARREVYISRDY